MTDQLASYIGLTLETRCSTFVHDFVLFVTTEWCDVIQINPVSSVCTWFYVVTHMTQRVNDFFVALSFYVKTVELRPA